MLSTYRQWASSPYVTPMVEAQKLSAHTLVDLVSRTSGATACYDLNNVPSSGEHFLNSGKHTNESSKACVLCITTKNQR